jgi:protein TonB
MITRQAQISAAASIIVHIAALLIFAGVKLYKDWGIEDSVPVTFVGEQKTIPLRRSIPIRPMISLDKSPQRDSPEQYTVRPEYRSSAEFYVSAPESVPSAVESIGQEVFRDTGIQRPSVGLRERLSSPMAIELRKEPHLRESQMQPRISGGYDFLRDMVLAHTKLSASVTDDVLQSFAEAVRRKIESKKRYPIAAQRVGIEGRTGIKMTILKDGRLQKVEIVKPSGYEILDRAALQSVRDAAPFPPIPKEMGRDEIQMSIHLVFKIT